MENIYNSLLEKNIFSDKNTVHSYINTYEELFEKKRENAEHILEIGIGNFSERNGGSLLLWAEYFKNATITGIDILPIDRVYHEVLEHPRIKTHTQTNAYSRGFIKGHVNEKLDIAIDDGPHTLDSMIEFIKLYSPLLKDDGILVVEDVQNYDWIEHLKLAVPDELKDCIKIYDLRKNKNRYDDILFVIDKSI
jgi:cephalosporin hydroxylase